MSKTTDSQTLTASGAAPMPASKNDRMAERLKLQMDYDLEVAVEAWLMDHFSDLGLGAALIGTQIELENGKRIDMLAIHKTGRLCVVELKRDAAEREVFVQTLDYARLISGFLKADLDAVCRKARGISLADFFKQHFKRDLPETWPTTPELVIVANDFDEPHVHMAALLKEHRFDLHLIRYSRENDDGDRRLVFHPVDISRKEFRVTGKMPDCVVVLRVAEQGEELWSACKAKGVLSMPPTDAGKIREFLKDGPVSLLVYLNNHGYVASGVINPKTLRTGQDWSGDMVGLPIQWDIAVEFEQAVFRGKSDQPKAGQVIRLGTADKDKWARLVGLLKFRGAKVNRKIKPPKPPVIRRKR